MISSLQVRIDLMVRLQQFLLDSTAIPESLYNQVKASNPWFTKESVDRAIEAIAIYYLDKEKLAKWVSNYQFGNILPKRVGLILAGNIPLVGFHDILTVFIAGHIAKIKLSDKDKVLTKYLLKKLTEFDSAASEHFEFVERLTDYDAIIATGSNSSYRIFEQYFSSVPHLLRKNRNAIAIIDKDTTEQQLVALGADMLNYFGLGCRNVSKVYIEKGIELARLFEAIDNRKDIIHHNKFKNNYDYSYALYLLNKEEFYTNDFLILRPNEAISSRISVVHYEYFENAELLAHKLESKTEEIQCLISSKPRGIFDVQEFGQSQQPSLTDYADGVDTLQFLLDLD